MTRNLVAVVAGGTLAFALAGAAGPAMGGVHPAGAVRAAPAGAGTPPVRPAVTAEAGHGPTVPPDPW